MQHHFWPDSTFPRRRATSPRWTAVRKSGVTLVEMLISVTLTLLIVFAVVQIFQYLGETVAIGRATIEMSGQLRTVSNRLQSDIDSLTCPAQTWIDPAMGAGYFRYQEGPAPGNDYPTGNNPPTNRTRTDLEGMVVTDPSDPRQYELREIALPIGDQDDVLAMTIRSRGEPFRSDAGLTSQVAEVVWWMAAVDTDGSGNLTDNDVRYLLRRVFLVLPGTAAAGLGPNAGISYRLVGGNPVANSLADLSTPENRMINNPAFSFPQFILPAAWQTTFAAFAVMSDVVAFDVRAYDPGAEIYVSDTNPGAFAVVPGDAGYAEAIAKSASTPTGQGAFVDLNFANLYYHYFQGNSDFQTITAATNGTLPLASTTNSNLTNSDFAGHPALPNTNTQWFNTPIAYDTWTTFYERDNMDNDGDGLVDEGNNGLDDDGVNGIDDAGERETRPPYDRPLRGIEVRIRMIEPSTGQVRQVSVVGDFVAK